MSLLLSRPPAVDTPDKIVLAGWSGDRLMCVVDVLRHWPRAGTAHIGLLMVHAEFCSRGIGTRAMSLLNDRARTWDDITHWRAGVVQTNGAVARFWESLGFLATGEVVPWAYDHVTSEVNVYAREV